MSESHGAPKHPYHLVDPSPWPLVGSLSAGALFGGVVMGLHGSGYALAIIGLLAVLATMFMWWRDVIREANSGHHTPVVQIGLHYGMALFIASEVMFFAAFFWAFFSNAIYPSTGDAVGGVWPPKGITPFNPMQLPYLNTLILLLSGTTVTWAHHSLIENNRRGLIWGLGFTVLLGLCFTTCQAIEYGHALFHFSGNIFGATFFMATGFHGFHVIIGTIFLFVCLMRAINGDFTPKQHFGLIAAAWYWHFVDAVWLFLFVCVYVWGSFGATFAE